MRKAPVSKKLAVIQERRRLTAEYLEWAKASGHARAVSTARKDLARHDRQLAKLSRRMTGSPSGRLRAILRDMVPASLFIMTATLVTMVGRWDAGVIGLVDGLGVAMVYLYFAKETGRLRL